MLVVNLTTTSTRLELCGATLWSLIHQSFLPDRIDLWVSKDAYMADQGISYFPDFFDELNKIKKIINIRFVENTGPYRKIFPALRHSNGDELLVYADDDVIYGHNWLKSLVDHFLLHEGKYAVASRVRLMKKNIFGKYQSYNNFDVCLEPKVVDKDFIITGVGGCILQKKHIKTAFILDENYLTVAPRTDDLWISKILEISNTSVAICPDAFCYVQEINHSNYSLNKINTLQAKKTNLYNIFLKVKIKVFGYLGRPLSNNDTALIKVNNYFNSCKVK
ncbi:glycosyltransferase family A protein [Brenneria sp. g21c3]|uniref:glycosyltransferase family A protein n=1 Tax=Brenneria sp. g21c3 TaxID=3093893 RepID=UPI002EB8A746|nr:glycosyltransferase family A protein [Brenneria sp. g21c3]